ncbi:hypothetical protein RO3G_04467 [Rhizopus delemar RA 99-880]|uniref:Uncharacterized protein n=1 Tax=Rhizopus delemar (strain RA 99-880 / ATCC MYA-4621 / FGSC 9543 / NRRL 43880) TaxID=246409 RepID=I1BU82_RHIO9|nr:hypothetical protein RO3G_04467 [Rhizopus delemar RA 99-880]|eukprot:EIE79762.1 hypothetical protein RO3G_04467 [Rhizopus delemar RA 99-880]
MSTFEAFEKYDFDNDAQFQSGIASLLNNKQENEDQLLLKAKLFYYSKFFTPIQYDEYIKWKDSEHEPEPTSEREEKPPRFTFQEIVDMIEKGIEIPGIKQIPNIINDGVPSESKMKTRPKPWEIKK